MSKYRIYELAKEFKTESKVILSILERNQHPARNHMSSVGEEERAIIARTFSPKQKETQAAARKTTSTSPAKDTPKAPTAKTHGEGQSQNHQKSQGVQGKGEAREGQQGRRSSRRNRRDRTRRAQGANANTASVQSASNTQSPNRPQNPTQAQDNRDRQQHAHGTGNANRANNTNEKRANANGQRSHAQATAGNAPASGNANTHHRGNVNANANATANHGQRRNGQSANNRRGQSNRGNGAQNRQGQGRTNGLNGRNGNGRLNHSNGNGQNARNNRFGKGRNRNQAAKAPAPKMEIVHPTHIKIGESIAVKELASKMSYTPTEVIKKLMLLGVMATINQEIDFDTASLVASEFDIACEALPPDKDPTEIPEIEDDPKSLVPRPPVVTVMGHVDHGKTSLLDAIRKTSVSAHEAGGITQHIGAYQVMCQGKKIVFLDTPGHEAFTAMRARGAQVTDIAILVVAADDGVMPQTIEAIHHAKAANVPIIVAINKIDKPGANPERVKQELAEKELVPEDWGGDTIMVPVSAKKKIGLNDLLEMVLLVAEMRELRANPNREARGVIIEAQLDKGRGPVATVLVQNGTLRVGDSIVAGTTYGKVRAMLNDRGENVRKAGPSVPVEVLGLSDVPEAGDTLAALEEKLARSIAEKRLEKKRTELIHTKKVSLDDLFQQIQQGNIKDLNIVIKADVQGSVEALSSSLLSLNKNDEVRVSIVHSGVGAVNESDVMLASAANALIIAFNVRPDANARRVADTENIDIRTYRVIYDALNDVKDAMSGMLAPKYKEVLLGKVEIRQVMKFSKALVAGCYVTEGKVTNDSKIRIVRDNVEIHDGALDSLRRFKDDVKEVAAGYECGLTIKDFRDFREGDVIEAYKMEEISTSIAEVNQAAAEKKAKQEQQAKVSAEDTK